MEINIYRLDWTDRGLFGHLLMDGFDCITLERTDKVIPAGRYRAVKYFSPTFKRVVLLLNDVPGRSYIEIHPADWENQLKGCIALASRRQNIENLEANAFAADNNKATFTAFMDALSGGDDIWLTIK